MAQILTYAAGVERQGRDGMTGRERQAKALMSLAQKFSRDMQANAMAGIAKSQADAQMDVIQNTIDPKRQENDEAYAGTVLRNNLNQINTQAKAALDNPAGEEANMKPEDYRKMLNDRATEFYDGLKDSDHAETQARIFTGYMAKNMPGLIAKQAKVYKDGMKAKQGVEATKALAELPPGEGDAFALNTDYLIDSMLPADRFTTEERLGIIMAAAQGAAQQGDRRLLDHAETVYDAEALMPARVQGAENAFTKAMRAKEDSAYGQAYAMKQEQADNGEYTKDQWAKDIEDPEMVRRWGRGTINGWKKQGHTAHVAQLNYDDGMKRFMAGDALTGIDDKTQQRIFKDAKRNILEAAVGKAQGNKDQAAIAAMSEYAFFMSKQGAIDKELKTEMGARLNRPVLTKEAWADPQFQEAAAVFMSLDKVLTPSQMMAQLGDEAYSNGTLVQRFLADAGGDPEKAADAYLITMNRIKDMPELKTKKPHWKETKEAVASIIDGSVAGHDPAMDRGFGMWSAADDAVHTGQISYEIEKQYGIEIGRGLDHESALKLATEKVASKTKYFGNEMIWTGGTDLNEMLYMPHGSTDNDRQKAWENFADGLGIDPDKAHFTMVGQYGWITDENGEAIEEAGLFPLIMIGNAYEQKTRDDYSEREARDLEDKTNDIASTNRLFETSMNARTGFDDNAQILADGTTLGDYKDSDEEGRFMLRKMYDEENRTWLGKMAMKFVEFKHDVQAGKYKGEAAERFRTVATEETKALLDGKVDVAAIRSIDARSADVKAQNDRLLRSRDGEVSLTPEERATLAEEDLKPALQESDIMDVPKTAYSGKTSDGKQIYNSKAFKGLSKDESITIDSEGFVPEPYEDSLGIKTIGIGHNLKDNPFDAEELKKFGKNRNWAKEPMTRSEALWLFRRDFADAKKDAKTTWPQFSRLSKNRQRVLADMTFNMGAKKFNPDHWPGLASALDARPIDWNRVAAAMEDSEWFKQVGDRAKKNIAQMKKG